MLPALLGLAACSADLSEKPAEWWHETVGGKIAEQRPPPPGMKDPYPNLATIPPKPPAADTVAWNRLTAGLTSDRIAASQAAALAPIPAPSSHAPAAPLFGAGAPPKPQEAGASAALEATTTPPSAPGKAPPPAKPPAPPVVPLAELQSPPPPTLAQAAGVPLPPLPTQEPARPGFAPGPPPPLTAVTAAPPREVPRPGAGSLVDFSAGSTDLTESALDLVKTLVAARGEHGIAVIGHGDAASVDPLVQSQALDLALRRAQSLATALVAQGVPYAALRIDAEAAGRGASLRLLQ
jgi:outer membrane protein OmpA-like peptidoglycan-associated protein